MMRQVRPFLPVMAVVCVVLWTMVRAQPVYACSCGQDRTLDAARDDADAIFAGRVVGSNGFMRRVFGGDNRYTFAVSEVWKGQPEARLVVRTGTGMGDCGYGFEADREYLVYANGRGDLETNICTRTVTLDRAQEDRQFLGAGVAPVAAPGGSFGVPVLLVIVGGAAAVAGVRYVVRSRRAA